MYTWQGSFTYIPVFKIQKILKNVREYFCWLFFKTFKIFKIMQNQDSSLTESIILNLLLKTNRFYLLDCFGVTVFNANPYFCLQTGKHEVTLMSSMANASNLAGFLPGCFILISYRVLEIWRWSVRNFGRYHRKREGAKKPPCQSRVKGRGDPSQI